VNPAGTRKCEIPSGDQVISRRDGIFKMAMLQLSLPAMSAALLYPATAAEAPTAEGSIPAQIPSPPRIKSYIARDFIVRYPTTFVVIGDSESLDVPQGRPRENPVRIELRSETGSGRVIVIQQQASKLKQTLFQITDITQLGTLEEVGRLLLPEGSKLLAGNVVSFPQAPRDTGTALGIIEREPIHQYRYQAVLRDGVRAEVAVGVILGRVLLLGATAPEAQWTEEGPVLTAIADSFKMLPK